MLVENRLDDAGDLADLRPWNAVDRVEVDAQLIRVVEILRAHGMRMQLEAGEIRHPRQARRAAWDDLVRRDDEHPN